jgi:hypothetical protein
MSEDAPEKDSSEEPVEWLVVPPTGVTGCPLEDWLAALSESGERPQARRQFEGLWIHFEDHPIVGFVSIERGLVEAINFEIPADICRSQAERIRQAAVALHWEIWEQSSDESDDDDWDEDFEQDEI